MRCVFFAPLTIFLQLKSVFYRLFIFVGKIIDVMTDRTLHFD